MRIILKLAPFVTLCLICCFFEGKGVTTYMVTNMVSSGKKELSAAQRELCEADVDGKKGKPKDAKVR